PDLVSLAPKAVPGPTMAIAIKSTTGRSESRRKIPADPLLIGVAAAVCGLLGAMTSVRVMPTSHWWCVERLCGKAPSLVRHLEAIACLLRMKVYQLRRSQQLLKPAVPCPRTAQTRS